MTPSLSLAQSSSGQGGNRSVPKQEREIHGVDFRAVNWTLSEENPGLHMGLFGISWMDCDRNVRTAGVIPQKA